MPVHRCCQVRKTSRRDLPVVAAQRCDGATTVSATMLLAARVGIAVFVTGGARPLLLPAFGRPVYINRTKNAALNYALKSYLRTDIVSEPDSRAVLTHASSQASAACTAAGRRLWMCPPT